MVSTAPLTVTELAGRIKRLLEDGIGLVTVTGEASNLRLPSSGHCYFVLKDAGAAINAVCFRNALMRQRVRPADGQKLEVTGRLSAYTARSEYQLIVESIREAGLGELMRQFLELKEKLRAQGLFETTRKRPIPRLPRRIGIVTSSTGAALRDMLNILRRRARGLTIYLAPCAVQGDAAPADIVCSLERLQRHHRAEVIIVGRGGGSIEDLWSFNDERVVRAIAASSIPVISAVGHETDTTLADYAADLRAPTPSAAAELVSAHYDEIAEQVVTMQRRLTREMYALLDDRRQRVERCQRSWGMRSPRERVLQAMQRLDDLQPQLREALRRRLARASDRLAQARRTLLAAGPARWSPRVATALQIRTQLEARLRRATTANLERKRGKFIAVSGQLSALSPEAVLQRGYSIVTHGKSGRVIKNPAQARGGDLVRIRSAQGNWRALALEGERDLFDQ